MPLGTLNRIVWIVLVALLAVLAIQTRDKFDALLSGVGRLEVRDAPLDNTVFMRWRGKIDAPMAARISETIQRFKSEKRRFVLSLSSPGGSLDHGNDVVALLRRLRETHGLETVVEAGSRCASMCVPIYLQGQPRTAAASARFMFHEVSFREFFSNEQVDVPDRARGRATDMFFARYFASAGVPDAWIRSVRAQMAGDEDVWKTAQDLIDEQSGIVQSVY